MNNPYQTPKAKIHGTPRDAWRIGHCVLALVAGLTLFPLIFFGAAALWFGTFHISFGNYNFWTTLILGSVIAAAAVYRHKQIPAWLAILIGPLVVLLLSVAPTIWRAVLT